MVSAVHAGAAAALWPSPQPVPPQPPQRMVEARLLAPPAPPSLAPQPPSPAPPRPSPAKVAPRPAPRPAPVNPSVPAPVDLPVPAVASAEATTAPAPVSAAPVPAAPIKVAARRDSSSSCRLPQYPADSRRNGESGVVQLEFLIEADGTAAEARVAQSSGFPRLDEAARRALALCRFQPGTVDDVPVRSWTRLNYVWRLE